MQLKVAFVGRESVPLGALPIRRVRPTRIRASEDREGSPSEPDAKKTAQNDILERIARAKAYKAQRAENVEPVAPPMPSPFGEEVERPADSARRLSNEAFQAQFNKGVADPDAPSFRDAVESESTPEQTPYFGGTADQAASFVPNDDSPALPQPNTRPEDWTPAEQARMRQRGAEIISVDKSYRPKISTWGMFPRPANISETYGGGRAIDPSQPLESEEVSERRQAEIEAALLDYKKKRGLYIEPEIEAQYTELFSTGQRFLNNGRLILAAEKFEAASQIVDFSTKYGGEALLKQAICLDSLGKSKPAKAIYEQLMKHPQAEIHKQARRMLFGFKAMDHLKVTKMKQTQLSAEYADYFAKLPMDWNSTYIAQSDGDIEEFDENLKLAVWISGLILLMPLALVLTLAFT